jgi:cobalt-precorrin-5B (C1)-methyltransferase
VGKLAQGFLDLHSRSGAIDLKFLAEIAEAAGAQPETVAAIAQGASGAEALAIAEAAGIALGPPIAEAACRTASKLLDGSAIRLDIAVFDRDGRLLASAEQQ